MNEAPLGTEPCGIKLFSESFHTQDPPFLFKLLRHISMERKSLAGTRILKLHNLPQPQLSRLIEKSSKTHMVRENQILYNIA